MKVLDYYYLVLLRGLGRRSDYRVTGIMGMTFLVNIFSLIILFNHNILDYNAFWIVFVISGGVSFSILDRIYNINRREKIIIKYKRENRESRQKGVAKVWAYEILSLGFLIFSVWLAVK